VTQAGEPPGPSFLFQKGLARASRFRRWWPWDDYSHPARGSKQPMLAGFGSDFLNDRTCLQFGQAP
jgi:hypothetical protein